MLDHHKTAAENLAGAAAPNLEVTLDMDRSGATIARDHFAPHGLTDAQQARLPLHGHARRQGGLTAHAACPEIAAVADETDLACVGSVL